MSVGRHTADHVGSRRRLKVAVSLLLVASAIVGVAIGLVVTKSDSTHVVVGSKPSPTVVIPKSSTSLTTAGRPVTPSSIGNTSTTSTSGALAGMVVAIDPGHNGGNFTDSSYINAPIWNGRESEACDTTGTETDAGYTEAQFNFNVAQFLAADLEAEGAKVVLTRTTNTGVGPCVTQRAAIGNAAHANAAVSIHADGGPATGRGFAVLEPVADGPNDSVIAQSASLGADIRGAFLSQNLEPVSNYDGVDGIQPRDDLAGLNLTTVPKVLVECANMRNAVDAALIVTPAWQQSVASVLAAAIRQFLTAG